MSDHRELTKVITELREKLKIADADNKKISDNYTEAIKTVDYMSGLNEMRKSVDAYKEVVAEWERMWHFCETMFPKQSKEASQRWSRSYNWRKARARNKQKEANKVAEEAKKAGKEGYLTYGP